MNEIIDVIRDLQQRITDARLEHARTLKQIRLNSMTPLDQAFLVPIPADKNDTKALRGERMGFPRDYEILIHPATWDRLARDHWKMIEKNVKDLGLDESDGPPPAETGGWVYCGIPVVVR